MQKGQKDRKKRQRKEGKIQKKNRINRIGGEKKGKDKNIKIRKEVGLIGQDGIG